MSFGNLKWSIDYYEANTKECDERLQMPDDFNEIPLLNSENLDLYKDGDLVRYQGMVQDMLNPEYYYPSYSLRNTNSGELTEKSGKYRDMAPCKDNEELNLDGKVPDERLVLYCIPLPGMSKWVKNALKKSNESRVPKQGTTLRKRPVEEDSDEEMQIASSEEISKVNKNKRVTEESIDAGISQNEGHLNEKYFPLNERDGLPCIVKIYEKEDKCGIVLNDRIEVIGFISLNPALESTWKDCDPEHKALHPPPSLVPRIHSIHARKLVHSNPFLSQNIDSSDIISDAEKVRSDLHLILTQILYGDDLAADYVICHLLSRVYSRIEEQALGKFSLNLCNIQLKNYCRRLYDILESLVTNSQFMTLSIESLNEKSFIPKKDYETNRLWSGRLQLCDDAHLIVDETGMNEGKLEHTGCLNVAALQNIIRDQEIHYDFSYYSVKYNTNVPVLILSEGKSILEADIPLKLKPDPSMTETVNETFDAASFFLNEEISQKIRNYLTCMRLQEFSINEELMRKIGDDYVSMRQQKNDVNTSDLHNLLVLSRLLALSYGRTSLTMNDWSRALEMETERKSRFT